MNTKAIEIIIGNPIKKQSRAKLVVLFQSSIMLAMHQVFV